MSLQQHSESMVMNRPIHRSDAGSLTRISLWLLFALLAFLCGKVDARPVDASFDHMSTGFVLTGLHEHVPCESCHKTGVFKGTPRVCNVCHASGSRINARIPPANNVHTLAKEKDCGACHKAAGWVMATFQHAGITSGCNRCHAAGGGATLPPVDEVHKNIMGTDCSSCHTSTVSFGTRAKYAHTNVTTGCAAAGCHAGAKVRARNHATMTTCESCHRYPSWTTVAMNHAATGGASCKGCHFAGGLAIAAKADALHAGVASLECSACHSTARFTGAKVNHSVVTLGCGLSGCHAGDQTKARSHTLLTDCKSCHNYAAGWLAATMNHSAVGATKCNACHVAGNLSTKVAPADLLHSDSVARSPNDCSACHTGTSTFAGARFNHTLIGTRTCRSCHISGGMSTFVAEPSIPAHTMIGTTDCAVCHKGFTTFAGAKFDHSTITTGCTNCHLDDRNNPAAKNHATLNSCESCHTHSGGWTMARMNHGYSAVTVMTCKSCHVAGNLATTTMPVNTLHAPTSIGSLDCKACHVGTTTFATTKYDHSQIGTTQCKTCHVTGGGATHVAPTDLIHANIGSLDCNASGCHSGFTTFTGAKYPHTGIVSGCKTCHGSGVQYDRQTSAKGHTGIGACELCHNMYPTAWASTKGRSVTHILTSIASATCKGCHALPRGHDPIGTKDCNASGCHSTSTWSK